jgi:benzoyl-CoA reductase/2-hydroxyglutaryl-CoA dehydratase subunit BcrC/BadD/HgdB
MIMLETLVTNMLLDPLATARAYQKAGGRVVGYVGTEIPVELIIAANAMPLQLSGLMVTDFKHADRYFEDRFEPSIRAIAEQYLQGRLDFLEFVILPRSNDSAQRLYYYLCELRRSNMADGPTPLIYDLAKIPRDSSLTHSEKSTQKLAQTIGTEELALPKAIALRNRRRELFAAANAARTRQNNVQGSFIDRVFRAADLCEATRFDTAFSDWLEQNQDKDSIPGPRLLLTGSAPPDERLHQAVETAGGNVVAEFGDFPFYRAQSPVIPEEGSFRALALHYHSLTHGPRAFINRAEMTVARAQSDQVDGVIQWLIEQEEALVWDVPAQKTALAAAGIPILSMVRRCWDASDGTIDEIISFTNSLRGCK